MKAEETESVSKPEETEAAAGRAASDEKAGDSKENAASDAGTVEKAASESEGASADAQPLDDEDANLAEATRLKQVIICLLLVFLLAATVAVVCLVPPLGSQPVSQTSESQFALGRKVMLLAPGDAASAAPLRYVPFSEDKVYARYKLYIQERNQYDTGATVRTEFRGDVLIRHGVRENERSIYVSLDDESVDVKVYDGETLREIQDAGSMYKGIIFEGRLDPVSGLSRLVPRVQINPQIGRVLYIITDVLRYAWVALPEQPVGVGGGWRMMDDSNMDRGESVNVTAALKEDRIALTLEHKTQNVADGNGNAELHFVSGEGAGAKGPGSLLSEYKGQIQTQLDHGKEGKGAHTMAFSLSFDRWEDVEEKSQ